MTSQSCPHSQMQGLIFCANSLKLVVLSSRIVSLSSLGEDDMRELKREEQFDNRQPYFDHGDDVTSAPGPLSNPQSRRTPTEVHYVA